MLLMLVRKIAADSIIRSKDAVERVRRGGRGIRRCLSNSPTRIAAPEDVNIAYLFD